MNKRRVLGEAQKIASRFSFWMVSGQVSHLYGRVYETSEKQYDLEIIFDENFPEKPPNLIFHESIKNLLGNIQLDAVKNWTEGSQVIDIVQELSTKIQKALNIPISSTQKPPKPEAQSHKKKDKKLSADKSAIHP
jgi:ubiquitin-protein ligase